MRLNDTVYILQVTAQLPGRSMLLNPTLLLDPHHGPSLVDTGVPGMLETFSDAVREAGLELADLRHILITHHDLDHIGSLPEIVRVSGAEVLASEAERPYIQGEKIAQKMPSAERLAQMPPEQREAMSRPRPSVQGVKALHDGQHLDLSGGVRVVLTPGHTVGHTSFFLERDRVLIAGDALTAEDGELRGPNPAVTPDLPTAHASVRALAALEPQVIVCYHGGVVSQDASGQLRRLAGELG